MIAIHMDMTMFRSMEKKNALLLLLSRRPKMKWKLNFIQIMIGLPLASNYTWAVKVRKYKFTKKQAALKTQNITKNCEKL